jgi:DNA mismatch repair ATPase MutL
LLLINGRAVRAAQLESLFTGAAQTPLNGRPLLIPTTLELSVEQVDWLAQHSGWLSACGFDLSPVGERQILLRQVPGAASSLEPNAWLPAFVDEVLAGVSPAHALATALSQPGICSLAEQQAVVRDALSWQPEARPARYWIRWDPEQLRTLFED